MIIFLGATDEMFFEMMLAKDRILGRFPINSIYKTNPFFAEVRFFDGKVESCNFLGFIIYALLAIFRFWSSTFFNHCVVNMLKSTEKTIRKTKIKVP